jgi:hypothetical protein
MKRWRQRLIIQNNCHLQKWGLKFLVGRTARLFVSSVPLTFVCPLRISDGVFLFVYYSDIHSHK